MRNYGSHLIIWDIGKFEVKVSVILDGLEKYMAFAININLVFIDSMQFMNSSLAALVKNLSEMDFKYLSEEFSGEFSKVVKQKGAYSYEYMDIFERFSENKLPDRPKSFSSLKGECISEKDCKGAINVWNVFKMNAMGDYHDVYLKTDVLLLADVFDKFRNRCLDYYGSKPFQYFFSPALSWDAMLKMIGIELEYISDIDRYSFIKKGMRGGILYVAKRHSKANNKYMKIYDSGEASKYITYFDANNLYGWAMSQYFPYSEFKWLNQKETDGFCMNSIGENSSKGYVSEVDLSYSSELHQFHNDYPLAPEKIELLKGSNHCCNISNKY